MKEDKILFDNSNVVSLHEELAAIRSRLGGQRVDIIGNPNATHAEEEKAFDYIDALSDEQFFLDYTASEEVKKAFIAAVTKNENVRFKVVSRFGTQVFVEC